VKCPYYLTPYECVSTPVSSISGRDLVGGGGGLVLLQNFLTDSVTHPASYPAGTLASLPGIKAVGV
jgi:hypothetical protein